MSHLHGCPFCATRERCTSPEECAKNKTRDVEVMCESCARLREQRAKATNLETVKS